MIKLPGRGRIWWSNGIIFGNLVKHEVHCGSVFDTLRECYDWMREYEVFDGDYEITIELPELDMVVRSDEDWAIALLTCKNSQQ